MKRTRVVWAVVVKTKHMLSDYLQGLRDMIGMNLVAYEKMLDDALGEAYKKLTDKYPTVYDVKFATSQIKNGAAEIICYGKIDEVINYE